MAVQTPYTAEFSKVGYGEETTYGTKATTTDTWPGILGALELPDPEREFEEVRAIGEGRDWLQLVSGRTIMEATAGDLIFQTPIWMFYAFGAVKEEGTDVGSGGGSTLDGATAVGATSFDVVDATNYAADDYIQIGDNGATQPAEIRKITDVTSNTITVDSRLRRIHATAETCNEVTTPYTHTFYKRTGTPILPSFSFEASFESPDEDFTRYFLGCLIDNFEIGVDEGGVMKGSLGIKASNHDSGSSPSTITSDSTTVPLMFHEGAITVFGAAFTRVVDAKIKMENDIEMAFYQQSTNGDKAYEGIAGQRKNTISLTLIADSADVWDLLSAASPASSTAILKYSRGANDYWQFTGSTCYIPKAPHHIPEKGRVKVPLEFNVKSLELEVKDAVPYY